MFNHFLQICLQDFNKYSTVYFVQCAVHCLLTYRVERRRPTEVKDAPRGYIYTPHPPLDPNKSTAARLTARHHASRGRRCEEDELQTEQNRFLRFFTQ